MLGENLINDINIKTVGLLSSFNSEPQFRPLLPLQAYQDEYLLSI